jgi:SAM-dependent methyltransferase
LRPSLDELARQHGTDKSRYQHGFAELYERELSGWREYPISVLEIGVYKGASLRMWRDYFPEGRIVGVDINPEAREYEDGRIEIRIGDQSDREFLQQLGSADGPFDLIVDDGGHFANQQTASLRELWPYLRPGGMYVVEDIHTSYFKSWQMGLRKPGTTVEYLKGIVDDLHSAIHEQPPTLADLESIQFRFELCVLRRAPASRGELSRG